MSGPSIRLLAIFFAASLGMNAAFTDDGSWSDSRGYTPAEGALYSVAGNPAIVLEKEYLELSDCTTGSTRAIFRFRNTSKTAQVIECAFPIRLQWYASPFTLDDVEGWDFGDGGGKYSPPISVTSDYGETIKDWLDTLGIPHSTFEPEDFEQGGNFIQAGNYPRGRKDYPAGRLAAKIALTIKQDGTAVTVGNCVADFGKEAGLITLHFRHTLNFAAGAESTVEVSYSLYAGSGSSGDPMSPGYWKSYEWNYVLETGASWKDPMGSLVLAVPPGFQGSIPSALKLIGTTGTHLVYRAERWEPESKDNLSLTWSEMVMTPEDVREIWRISPRELSLAGFESPFPGISNVSASSFLSENGDIYVSRGLLRKVPFDAARLFDGLRETCWVEGKKDDGIGEYVAFALANQASVLAVQNGYLRSPMDFPELKTWSFFSLNNRVKTLELRKDSGELVVSLPLADSRDLQYFPVALPPGRYRAVIASIYPGNKWKDTCLGELIFMEGSLTGLAETRKDPFYARFLKGK